MKANTSKDRAVGAIMGTFIGDALGVGPHWYYDLDRLRQDYGDWIDDFTSHRIFFRCKIASYISDGVWN